MLFCLPGAMAAGQAIRVIDGDTIAVRGTTFRIDGIDAPEHGQRCGGWACGEAATHRMAELVNSGAIECAGSEQDTYGRTIGTCRIAGQDIGEQLVSEGLARAFLKYSRKYEQTQAEAKSRRVGIW